MSQPGHEFTLSGGHSSHQNPDPATQSAFQIPAGFPAGALRDQEGLHRSGLVSGFGHSAIPGLGLGLPNNSTTLPERGARPNGHTSGWQPVSSATNRGQMSPRIPGLGRIRHSASEDGEVSEHGELSDKNEPVEAHLGVADTGQIGNADLPGAQNPLPTMQPLKDSSERSGSYSPYLSPQELSQPGSDLPLTGPGTSFNTTAAGSHRPNESHAPGLATKSQPNRSGQSGPFSLEYARKQAKDAILRLWSMNFRFQNYLSEGIDANVLKSLFLELGLSMDDEMRSVQKAKRVNVQDGPSTNEKAASEGKTVPADEAATAVHSVVDSSEERKDRIARLLAAKGTKQVSNAVSAPSIATHEPAAASTAETGDARPRAKVDSQSTKPTMTQSEKSILLQQKVAALKQARALQQHKPSQPKENGSSKDGSSPEATPVIAGAVTAPEISKQAIESLPGQSISAAKLGRQMSEGQPIVAVVDDVESHDARLIVPFDQKASPRPFLITVSEDEDEGDEEMDIDSAGRPQTPEPFVAIAPRDALLRDASGLSSSAGIHQVRSPGSAPTTPLRSTSGMNGIDLESMNKQIEQMKQKIAEAEARKKVKTTRQDSSASSQRNERSQDEASDSPSRPSPTTSGRSYGVLGTGINVALGSPIWDQRSRSRAASERLPLLEARRREQLEKLKTLQHEVARIERELQEDMVEEERLKLDLLGSGSDQGHDDVHADLPTQAGVATHDQTLDQREDFGDKGEELLPASSSAGHDASRLLSEPQAPEASVVSNSSRLPENETTESMSVPDGNVERSASVGDGDGAPTASPFAIHLESNLHSSREASLGKCEAPPVSSQLLDSTADAIIDAIMEDMAYSADEDADGESDGYEPTEATSGVPAVRSDKGDAKTLHDPVPLAQSLASPDAVPETLSPKEPPRVDWNQSSGFVPYESPLQYFRAYRFHPLYRDSVAGGLRSLTYSNKIDAKMELCPDELAGQQCPRGERCIFQHFKTMQAPDDQILLQLGTAALYDEKQREEFNEGLRRLLTDYQSRKVWDFDVISRGVVDYRARFLGDKSKILPLGHISI